MFCTPARVLDVRDVTVKAIASAFKEWTSHHGEPVV